MNHGVIEIFLNPNFRRLLACFEVLFRPVPTSDARFEDFYYRSKDFDLKMLAVRKTLVNDE